MVIITSVTMQIQAHAQKVALEFMHLQQLLDHWASTSYTMSRVPSEDAHAPPSAPMSRWRSKSHSRRPSPPRGRPAPSNFGPPRGKVVASASNWNSPPRGASSGGSPPPGWGIVVPLSIQMSDQGGWAIDPLESKEFIKRWDGEGLAKMAMAALAAGVLIIGSTGDAMAAKSGGRVGGQAFRSSHPPSSAPRSSGPRINNSRTNVFINPPVTPPIFGGYGFGTPFFGGWGWSPFSFIAPGPSVAIGFGGEFEFFGLLLVLVFVGNTIRNLFNRDDYDDDYFD
ncbi:hypothetical protein KI387_028666 [Taxus chinensis]|uniref:Uncharacterized protein n=1 Tax=Taxus chinensis TaxID=29808 RepID=A0AA38CJ31_TAXCH|nr:hypothetical protein KI387_028666 [Taxus chinensis]